MSAIELEVYEIFKLKLGEKEAAKVIEYIEIKAEQKVSEKNSILATKEDLANVKVDMLRWVFSFFVVLMLAIIGLYFKK